jgi:dTDP-4-dehydrorhamnose reductase
VSHQQLDIADPAAVDSVVREFGPDVLINAAGFTRVDDAETEREAAERANATGPAVLAAASRSAGAWLVQVSTDYVFDGEHGRPYVPAARTNPLSVYGKTKLQGELAVTRELPAQSTVVRTSWLYAAEGRNFLTTMLRLMKNRPQLSVVSDQIGAPTNVTGLARVLWAFTLRRASGLYHWCDSGVASWYDFAVAIGEEAVALGVLSSGPPILPVSPRRTGATHCARRWPSLRLQERRVEAPSDHRGCRVHRCQLLPLLGRNLPGRPPGGAGCTHLRGQSRQYRTADRVAARALRPW